MAAVVQHSSGGSTSASSIATGATSSTTGNLICVFVRRDPSGTITSVTDTAGNTYTSVVENTTGNPYLKCFYAKNITGNASNVVTAAFSGTIGYVWIHAIEVSGLDTSAPLDVYDDKDGTGTTSLVTDAITTASAGIILAAASQSGITDYTAGSSFTLTNGGIGSGGIHYGGAEYYITSGSVSSFTPGITSGITSHYVMIAAAFKDAAAAGNPWYYYANQ